jgi:predicted kinase
MITLIRGCSGSGKSSLAKTLIAQAKNGRGSINIEADNWYVDDSNTYNFDITEIKNAHAYCKLTTEYYLRKNFHVIVSNTFTTLKEIMPYVELCVKYGVPLNIMEPPTSWFNQLNECISKNVHKVPPEIIENQIKRYEFIVARNYSVQELQNAPDCFTLNRE